MKKLYGFLALISLLAIAASTAPAESPAYDNEVIAEVNNEKITFGDLDRAFKKNMNRSGKGLRDISIDSVYDFLELYINYRLKVHDALGRGYNKDQDVIDDITENRRLLAESFFYDKELTDPEVERWVNMRDWEYKFAFILINKEQNPSDSMKSYNEALEALGKLKEGTKFEDVAKEYSDDRESAKEGGIVPRYITSGMVQRPIENAIYSTEPGNIYPEPISTKYGYFIIKVLDKSPRVKVRASHILFDNNENSEDDIKRLADSLINELRGGADFATLAEKFSDDPGSAMKGGYLGQYYSRSSGLEQTGGPLVADFENALFELEDGEISNLVVTNYGMHIIKRDSTKQFDTEKEREQLRKLYKKLYFTQDKQDLLDSLAIARGFKINGPVFERFIASLDTGKTNNDTTWASNVPDDIKGRKLFEVLNKEFTAGEFIDIMNKPDMRGTALNTSGIKKAIEETAEPLVFADATKDLETIYPEFAMLMKEFKDGILLFKVEAEEVWEKIRFDSALAKTYYDTLSQKIYTDELFEIQEIFVASDSLADQLYKRLQKGVPFSELAKEHTQRKGYREKEGKWGFLTPSKNKLAEKAKEMDVMKGHFSEPFEHDNGYSIVKVLDYEAPREKSYEEAVPDIAPAVQDIMQKKLTEAWIAMLKDKFSVNVYDNKIKNIVKSN
ncbi:MAG: peptidylprolyl isomerase [Candidatus Kapaibacterium sp.]